MNRLLLGLLAGLWVATAAAQNEGVGVAPAQPGTLLVPASSPASPASDVPPEPVLEVESESLAPVATDEGTTVVAPKDPNASGVRSHARLEDEESDPLLPIKRKWAERQRILAVAEPETADQLLLSLKELRLDSGIDNLPAFSIALFREAKSVSVKDPKRAQLLGAAAVGLSPEEPTFHWQQAMILIKADILNLPQAISSGVRSVLVRGESVSEILRFQGNLLAISMCVLLLIGLGGMFFLAVKYAYLFSHVLEHALIFKLPAPVSRLLTFAVLFIPSFLGLGPGWLLLLWTLVFFPFARLRERIFLVGVAAGLLSLSIGGAYLASVLGVRTSPNYRLVDAISNEITLSDLRLLQDSVGIGRDRGERSFALGLLAKRRGVYGDAKTYLEEALGKGYDPPATLTNLGNVLFASGDPEAAIGIYQKAQAAKEDFFPALYNLGQAFYEVKDVRRGTDALEAAKNSDAGRMNDAARIKSANFNRLLVDAEIPRWTLIRSLYEVDAERELVRNRIWNFWFRPVAPRLGPVVGGVVVFGLVLVSLLSKFVSFPQSCVRCHQPACQWCFFTANRSDLCSQCFHLFVRKESVDPAARQDKEAEISRTQRSQAALARWAEVFWPGAGHFLQGKTATAFLIQVLFWGPLLLALWAGGPYPSAVPASITEIWTLWTLAGGVSAIVYIVSNRSVRRET